VMWFGPYASPENVSRRGGTPCWGDTFPTPPSPSVVSDPTESPRRDQLDEDVPFLLLQHGEIPGLTDLDLVASDLDLGTHRARRTERHLDGVHVPSGLRLVRDKVKAICYSFTRRRRSEFPITDTELPLIAALAMIGLSKRPNTGYSTPAAIGTPS